MRQSETNAVCIAKTPVDRCIATLLVSQTMHSKEQLITHQKPISTQASRIIGKFGGVNYLKQALEFAGMTVSRDAIYKWMFPKCPVDNSTRGTGGIIPVDRIPWVKKAARLMGVALTNDDWAL